MPIRKKPAKTLWTFTHYTKDAEGNTIRVQAQTTTRDRKAVSFAAGRGTRVRLK